MPEPRPEEAPTEKQPAADLLPDVYSELRRLAPKLSGPLQPGQTLQPTALVHEAYLRPVRDKDPGWEGRQCVFDDAGSRRARLLQDPGGRARPFGDRGNQPGVRRWARTPVSGISASKSRRPLAFVSRVQYDIPPVTLAEFAELEASYV